MTDTFDLAVFLKNLPNLPGVYRMLDKNGQVLYVGKAVNLKNRVRSYFSGSHSPRIALMVRQIDHIEVTVTRSEAEALILENNLIKSLSPRYNILFRDDKSYPYLKLSAHDFPQMSYYRGNLKPPHRYFGPFPNAQAVRDSIDVLQKVFRLRTCEDSVFAHRDRPCLLHQIHRCSAPCISAIDASSYHTDVAQACDFLDGKTDDLMHRIRQDMHNAAEKLWFEQAASLRDRLQALTAVQAGQFIDSRTHDARKDIDIIAVAAEHGLTCIHLVSIRGARRILDNSFFPGNNAADASAQTAAEAFIAQRYLGKAKPDIIIGNFRLPEVLHETLNTEAGRKIAFVARPQRERKVWLDMAYRNAQLAIEQRALQGENQRQRQHALAEIMRLPEVQRIECFDISHTFGEATVASCVVYDNDAMQNAQYRRFNIRTVSDGNDYAAMREALTRRYTKLAANEADAPPRPDVVVIDGGKGQITVAQEVWADLGLDIPLIGVAKGPERRAGEEDLILPASGEILQLPPQHPALHLLQTVRDEAHRFAITGHRKQRAAKRNHSQLDDIPGVGTKRRRELMARFGSVRSIQAASLDALTQVPGISTALADKIYRYFHDND